MLTWLSTELEENINANSDPTRGRNINGGHLTNALNELSNEERKSAV